MTMQTMQTVQTVQIAILGPGALGCLFACLLRTELSTEQARIILVDHRRDRADRRQRQGRSFVPLGEETPRRVQIECSSDPAALGPVDLVLVCTKAHQTSVAMAQALPLVGPKTLVWSLQNGLGNMEALAQHVRPQQVLGGVTRQGAYWREQDLLVHAGSGDSWWGAMEKGKQDIQAIMDLFTAAGVAIQHADDVRLPIWNKLLISAGINPLTALARVTNGQVADNPALRQAARILLEEAVAVAAGQGIELNTEQAFASLLKVARDTADNRSSMRCDVDAGRKTEIDAINGAVARLGHAPANALVTELILACEQQDDDGA